MRRLTSGLFWVVAAATGVACHDPLTVTNLNQPDVGRVLAQPADIERLISTGYQTLHKAHYNTATSITPEADATALETYATVANNGMNLRAAIPRNPVKNDRGNQTLSETLRDFSELQKLSRTSVDGINALDKLIANTGTLGSPAQNARARAFGFFILGLSLADVALVYDSAAIVTTKVGAQEVPPLSGYADVMAAALGDLDTALAIASSSDASSNPSAFSMQNWINGVTLAQSDFKKLIHSYKARYRAGVARTPTERAAVDWAAVIADANAGITADFLLTTSNKDGWPQAWLAQAYQYVGWHMMPPQYIAFADTSGGFDTWLNTPLQSRTNFLIITPDKRFPAGTTRPDQQTASGSLPTSGFPYFRNRPSGEDTPGDPWANSYYDHYRFRSLVLNNANRDGQWPIFTKAENDMLAAEGYIRKNDAASAAALIDKTRTRAGLPALSGTVLTTSDPVPGGNACVPRVPVGPNFTSSACGNIMEAMKYEKRLETLFTGFAQWYIDERGWGDLVTNSAYQFPVPYQEMDARLHPFYNLGGGGPSSSVKGTYGY